MAYTSYNFRSTQGFVTDPAGSTYIGAGTASYASTLMSGTGFGWVAGSTIPSLSNKAGAIDPRIAGLAVMTSAGNEFRIDMPNGTHKIRAVAGGNNVAARCGALIYDGPKSLPTGYMTRGQTVALNSILVNDTKTQVFKCVVAGTTDAGGTGPQAPWPGSLVGEQSGAIVVDGTVRWRLCGILVLDLDSVSNVPSGSVITAGGTILSETTWSDATDTQKTATIYSGYMTVTRHFNHASNIRHVGYELQSSSLSDMVLYDEDGLSMGTSPVIYAGQPEGKFVARIFAPTGTNQSPRFTVSGTLGGSASQYFTVTQNNDWVWLRATATRLPDNASGTVVITQSDSIGSRSTTFTPNVVSSQGRSVDNNSVWGMLSTQAWLRYRQVKSVHDSLWQGYQGQFFYSNGDVTATSANDLVTKINQLIPLAGNGRWFRIRCQAGGDWSTNITIPVADFLKDGTGGILITRDTGHNPQISGRWIGDGMRGFEFNDLTISIARGSVASNTTTVWLLGNNSTSSVYHAIVVRKCRLGTRVGTNPAPLDATAWDWNCYPIRVFHGEVLRVLDCLFDGFSNGIDSYGVRAFQTARNEFKSFQADLHGVGCFSGSAERKGIFADDHCYFLNHDNVARNAMDIVNLATWTNLNQNPHCDFIQERTVTGYPRANVPGTGATVGPAVLGQWSAINDNYYVCTQAGTSAGTGGPTGTGTNIADGTIRWNYVCPVVAGPRIISAIYNNVIQNAGTTFRDVTGTRLSTDMQFYIRSNGEQTSGAAIFNNLIATKSAYGVVRIAKDNVIPDFIEYNSFVGPSSIAPQPAAGSGVVYSANAQQIFTNSVLSPPNAFRARKNFVMAVTNGVHDEDNVIVGYRPTAPVKSPEIFEGSFSLNADGYYVYAIRDDGVNPTGDFIRDMFMLFKPKPQHTAIGTQVKRIDFTILPGNGFTGTPLVANLVILPADTTQPLPVWSVQPSISGTPQVGQTLTGTDGTFTGTLVGRQWLRNGTAITGATNSTYLLVSADTGTNIAFRVTAANASGQTSQAASVTIGPITSQTITISGSPPDAIAGQPYQYSFDTTGPTTISSADAAKLAAAGLTYNGTTGTISGNPT